MRVSIINNLLHAYIRIFVNNYNVDADTRSLYIHWPFCPYRCHFCPFVAFVGQDDLMETYHNTLMKEIKDFAAKSPKKLTIETVYIGGGTPSTWPDKLLLDMSGILRDTFDMENLSEMTLEANPGTVNPEQIAVWKKAGINRVSIGVQSLNDGVLRRLNRHQKASDVRNLLNWTGGEIETVSVDVIIGLPGVTDSEWKEMIEELITWPIKHVSMYFLSIHENTPLYTRISKNEFVLPEDDAVVDLYYWTVEKFAEHGFEQYEVSSFAKRGHESLHNQVYWERKPYKGFGVGACSFDGKLRFENRKNLERYCRSPETKEPIVVVAESLSQEQIRLERLMLGLRRRSGVKVKDIIEGMKTQEEEKFLSAVKELEEKSFLFSDSERIYLSKMSLAIENEIAIRLLK